MTGWVGVGDWMFSSARVFFEFDSSSFCTQRKSSCFFPYPHAWCAHEQLRRRFIKRLSGESTYSLRLPRAGTAALLSISAGSSFARAQSVVRAGGFASADAFSKVQLAGLWAKTGGCVETTCTAPYPRVQPARLSGPWTSPVRKKETGVDDRW